MLHDSQQEYLNIIGNSTGYAKAAAIKAMGLESTQSWLRSNEDEVNADKKSYNLANSARSSGSNYNKQISNLANDQYTTARDQKDILAENLALEYAIANEKWPDLMKAIKEIVPAISSMFATYVGGKLLGKVGGNLLGLGGKSAGGTVLGKVGSKLSSVGTYIGSGLANGFSNKAPIVKGAGKIGAFTGNAGALAGAAGIAAGGAMAIKGGTDVYNDIKNKDVTWKTGASAGGALAGAGGAVALGVLGASNPVGWVALGVGALALGARKVR